jgi:pimeloyl-ACP methyl ester carboxylesterase
VLEAGGGGNVLEWSRVQPDAAQTTRVCSYDRAGLGWSDQGPNPRSAAQIVSELHALLQAARVPGPYVLTAHSIGGLYVRLYASTYPNDVAGMVLVDTTHEDFQRRMPADAGAQDNPLLLHLVVNLHRFMTVAGYARLTGIRFAGGQGLSPEARELAEGIKVRTTVPFADGSETLATEESAAQVRRTRYILNVPLVVVTRGRYDRIQGLPQENQERIKRAWQDMQADLVTLSPQGSQMVAANSDHYVHVRQPEVVIDAIRTVVGTARRADTVR